MAHPALFASCAFLMLMLILSWVGYRLVYKPGRFLRQLGRPVITNDSARVLDPARRARAQHTGDVPQRRRVARAFLGSRSRHPESRPGARGLPLGERAAGVLRHTHHGHSVDAGVVHHDGSQDAAQPGDEAWSDGIRHWSRLGSAAVLPGKEGRQAAGNSPPLAARRVGPDGGFGRGRPGPGPGHPARGAGTARQPPGAERRDVAGDARDARTASGEAKRCGISPNERARPRSESWWRFWFRTTGSAPAWGRACARIPISCGCAAARKPKSAPARWASNWYFRFSFSYCRPC